jgi:hypothetical protein
VHPMHVPYVVQEIFTRCGGRGRVARGARGGRGRGGGRGCDGEVLGRPGAVGPALRFR